MPHLAPRAVLTTNTSGLPVKQIAAGFGHAAGAIEKRFGTHFFNPPRYMRLLEIIPAPESDPAVVAAFAAFADRQLGKQIVFANDTPNFIANRIGVAVTFTAATLMLDQGLTIEEVDALTGPAIGWPRTGTFRLADMVGIDVLAHVAANFPQGAAQGSFSAVLQEIVKRGWLGDKTGQGFYKKSRGADGKDERFVLDVKTFEYRPLAKAALPSLDMAKNAPTLKERLKLLLANDPAKDKAARFLAVSLHAVELRRGPHRRSGRRCRLHRSRHEGRFQLGAGPVRDVGCGRSARTVARMKSLSLPVSPARRLCSPRDENLLARLGNPTPGGNVSSRSPGKWNRFRRCLATRGLRISGARTASSAATPALRLSISATASAASSSIRSRTPSAATWSR